MTKQLIFKEKYAQKLKNQVESDQILEHYKSTEFVYDSNQVLMLPNIEKPDGLVKKLNSENDYNTAICIYEAFKFLEPIQASDERLWTYLTHVDLYEYMTARWSDVYTGKSIEKSKYILDHWFLSSSSQSNLLRHSLAGLWWAVFLSVDEKRGENRYDLTRILFRQLDFMSRTLGAYKLGRHKEAVIGILEFIMENDSLFRSKFEDKTRFIMKHFNLIGGVKPISYYDRTFFKAELQKIFKDIAGV